MVLKKQMDEMYKNAKSAFNKTSHTAAKKEADAFNAKEAEDTYETE